MDAFVTVIAVLAVCQLAGHIWGVRAELRQLRVSLCERQRARMAPFQLVNVSGRGVREEAVTQVLENEFQSAVRNAVRENHYVYL